MIIAQKNQAGILNEICVNRNIQSFIHLTIHKGQD